MRFLSSNQYADIYVLLISFMNWINTCIGSVQLKYAAIILFCTKLDFDCFRGPTYIHPVKQVWVGIIRIRFSGIQGNYVTSVITNDSLEAFFIQNEQHYFHACVFWKNTSIGTIRRHNDNWVVLVEFTKHRN